MVQYRLQIRGHQCQVIPAEKCSGSSRDERSLDLMLFSDNSFTNSKTKSSPHMQRVQFIIQPAFGFMNPIKEYWSHQYQCAVQFYLNENSTRFGCRERDSFVLLCLSLAALKRCFANHKGCNCHIICPGPQATSDCHHQCDKAIYVLKGVCWKQSSPTPLP